MKVKAKEINGIIYFSNFMVIKESENFYGVYEHWNKTKVNDVITSGTSLNNACKKAKLLQIGYDIYRENLAVWY